jgi:hypothetical protein
MNGNRAFWLHSADTWLSLAIMAMQPDVPNCLSKFDDAVRELCC